MALDKAGFLAIASQRKVVEAPIKGADDVVYVREISAGERDTLEAMSMTMRDNPERARQQRARCVAMFLSDADGNRIFGNNEIAQLDTLNANVLDQVLEAGMRLNGLGDDVVEVLEKN